MSDIVLSRDICKQTKSGHHKYIIAPLYQLNEDVWKQQETISFSTFFLRCHACNMIDNTRQVIAKLKIVKSKE